MRERLVCEERLRPEAPGTEPCFLAELGEMFGASSWANFRWTMRRVQCMLIFGRRDCCFAAWLRLVWLWGEGGEVR